MDRMHRSNNNSSRRWLGLKIFVALMVGVSLAMLVTQYETLQQRVRRVNGRLGEEDLSPAGRAWREAPGEGNGITDKFETFSPQAAEPAPEPEWKAAEVTITEPVVEGQFIPENGAHECPPAYPIKGNSKSHIYHLPSGALYNVTIPNICFATEEAAEAAGYRATKR